MQDKSFFLNSIVDAFHPFAFISLPEPKIEEIENLLTEFHFPSLIAERVV